LVTGPAFKPNLLHFAINVGKLFTGGVHGSAFRVERKGLSPQSYVFYLEPETTVFITIILLYL
jgi:hypothetical protein